MFAPAQQRSEQTNFAAFTGGVNASTPLYGMAPNECIYSFNLIANEYGMSVRSGSIEWTNMLTGNGVTSVMPYQAANEVDELFAATSEGIFDASIEGTTPPPLAQAWTTPGGRSGQCIHINYTNDAHSWLLVADPVNGYWTYNPTDGWVNTVLTSAVDAFNQDEVAFVMVFKERIWFIARDSSKAYYLPVDAVGGAVTLFNFGTKFQRGGELVGLFNWTLDGGDGIDDYLVAISHDGDCLIYQGTDPDVVGEWGIKGTYYVGEMPEGRRVAVDFGGDLLILSTLGVLSLQQLLNGSDLGNSSNFLTQRISKVIRDLMFEKRNLDGWALYNHARENFIMITVPVVEGLRPLQLVMDTTTKAWSFYRDLPIASAATYQGEFIMGMDDETMFSLRGNVDNVLLDGSGTADIQFSLLSSYLDAGSPAKQKKTHFLRPTWRAGALPSYKISASYDYDFEELFATFNANTGGQSAWQPDGVPGPPYAEDVALWDEAIWAGALTSVNKTSGGAGMGRTIAIALKGSSRAATDLVDINYVWETQEVFRL